MTSPDAVRRASREFDDVGWEQFLSKQSRRDGPFYRNRHETRESRYRVFRLTDRRGVLSAKHRAAFQLLPLYDFDPDTGTGKDYVMRRILTEAISLQLQAIQFRAKLISDVT
jgi:hypothetical protein